MTTKMLDAVTAVGVSKGLKVSEDITKHRVDVAFKSLAATKISALVIKLQGALNNKYGVISNPTLAVGSPAEKIGTAAFDYEIDGVSYHKAAANTVFSANYVVSASKYGVINVYIDSAGAITTLAPATTQAYESAALAHAAADEIETPSGKCYLGRILINADTGDWTANTDDLTDASDLTSATFISETSEYSDMATYTFSAADITKQKATFIHTDESSGGWVRLYLSTLTGTGEVDAWYTSVQE